MFEANIVEKRNAVLNKRRYEQPAPENHERKRNPLFK
jgi:hypothetical protein